MQGAGHCVRLLQQKSSFQGLRIVASWVATSLSVRALHWGAI